MPFYTRGCGRIEIEMSMEQAQSASHQGRCDDDVAMLAAEPDIAAQLEKIKPDVLRDELRDYGAWDADELADHEQNLQRIVWLAAGDIVENEHDDAF
jgi:hypothetical protein